ncbi:MAG: tetratricopeptide repeat protein, partial [Thermoplasmata archaeon]
MPQSFEEELARAMEYHVAGNTRKTFALTRRMREQYPEKQNLCKIFLLEGDIYFDINRWKKAVERYAEARKVCEDLVSKIKAMNGIARAYWRLGRYQDAVGILVEAAEEIAKINDKKLSGESNINIGNIYLSIGDYTGAIRHYELAIKTLTEICEEYMLSRAYNNIGEAYKLSGNVAEAVHCYLKARELGKRSGNIRIWAYATENLAECYAKLHNFEMARENAEEALKYFKKVKDTMMIGITYMALGMIFREMKEFEKAERYFKIAKNITTYKIKTVEEIHSEAKCIDYSIFDNSDRMVIEFSYSLFLNDFVKYLLESNLMWFFKINNKTIILNEDESVHFYYISSKPSG